MPACLATENHCDAMVENASHTTDVEGLGFIQLNALHSKCKPECNEGDQKRKEKMCKRKKCAACARCAGGTGGHAEEKEVYTFPAEFEEHDAVWIGFPNAHYLEIGGSLDPKVKNRANGRTNRDVVAEIVYHLSTHKIMGHVCVVNEEQEDLARTMFEERGVKMAYVNFFDVPFGDSWLRDMGAPFLVGDKGGLKVLDMSFDEWSLGDADIYAWPYIWVDEHVDREIARHLDLPTYLAPDLVHEGGNTEVNGAGILMTTRDTVLRRNANKALTPKYGASTADDLGDIFKPWGREEEYITKRLLESYGQKQVLWMETGLAEDDTAWEGPFKASVKGPVYSYGVGGHIDEFARFVSKDTVLLVQVTDEEAAASPIANETQKRMEANFKTLEEAVDEHENNLHLEIIRLPSAPEVYTPLYPSTTTNTDGDELLYLLMSSYNYKCDASISYKYCQDFPYGEEVNMMSAASYANFLVTNGLVLAPKYCNEWAAPYQHEGCPHGAQAKDEEAKRIFERVFPGRDIVMIDVAPLNVCGGGIHCYTQQQPKRRTML